MQQLIRTGILVSATRYGRTIPTYSTGRRRDPVVVLRRPGLGDMCVVQAQGARQRCIIAELLLANILGLYLDSRDRVRVHDAPLSIQENVNEHGEDAYILDGNAVHGLEIEYAK